MPDKKKGLLQTVLVPKDKFTLTKAKTWVVSHGFKAPKVDSAANFYRFRQATPKASAKFYTVSLPNGVELVYQVV